VKGLEDEHSDKGLKVVWIGFQDSREKIRAYAEQFGIRPVGFDCNNRVAKHYDVSFGAGAVLVDAHGVVKGCLDRGFSETDLRDALAMIL
jgi:cytochrome oxidase Cu insertion factor (SCO1/SenC/PrrC family)